MFELYTDGARRVMALAKEEAERLKHNYIGTEHILLGIVKDKNSVAAQVLTEMGLKLKDVEQKILNLLGE